MDKIINSRCICNIGLSWTTKKQVMILPCEHIIHINCHKTDNLCDICNNEITKMMTFEEIKSESKNGIIQYQRYIDMIASSNVDHIVKIGKHNAKHLSDVMSFMSTIPFMKGYDELQAFCHEILRLLNTKLIINGYENINESEKKVYISNHTTYIDTAVINSLFKCGYVVSSLINKSHLGRMIRDIVPILIIDHNKKGSSTVEQMSEYIKNNNSLCLFPEGVITHPDIIQNFRTGSFHTGYPVQPIIIVYDKIIYDNDIYLFLEKVLSTKELTITVTILKTEYPPFDDKKIEEIRCKMAKAGNLAVSRISNRDIK